MIPRLGDGNDDSGGDGNDDVERLENDSPSRGRKLIEYNTFCFVLGKV